MSFGFSVGDFLTAASLIQDIVSSLRTSSILEYRELILELHGLQRALHGIEHLRSHPEQEAAINGIKVAALMCQHPLNEFAGKLKKFDSLGTVTGGKKSKADMVKLWSRKLQWGFCMQEEVAQLRAYLVVHVGSLNLRMITQGLTTATIVAERAADTQVCLGTMINSSHRAISDTQNQVKTYGSITRTNNSILERLSSTITKDMTLQLKTIVDLATRIWQSHMHIIQFIVRIQHSSPSPDLRYTWVQEPVKFEDAIGRVIPIPSEYSWGKLEAIIMDQFKDGPGHRKVLAGEYELFNTFDSTQIISGSESKGLIPGMSITMAIIVGQYMQDFSNHCLRPGCKSTRFVSTEAGGRKCVVCNIWFDLAVKSLPRSFSPHDFEGASRDNASTISRGRKGRNFNVGLTLPSHMQAVYKRLRTERQNYKNVRIHVTPLPQSPTVSSVRCKKKQGSFINSVGTRMLVMPPTLPAQHGKYQSQARCINQSRPQDTQLPVQSLEASDSIAQVPEYPPSTQLCDVDAAYHLGGAFSPIDRLDFECSLAISCAATYNSLTSARYPPINLSANPVERDLLAPVITEGTVAAQEIKVPSSFSSTLLATKTQNETAVSALQAGSPSSSRSPRPATSQHRARPRRTAQTVLSEPNWQAMSDTASSCTASTAPAAIKLDELQPNGQEDRRRMSTARKIIPKFNESSWGWQCIHNSKIPIHERLWVEASLKSSNAQFADKDY